MAAELKRLKGDVQGDAERSRTAPWTTPVADSDAGRLTPCRPRWDRPRSWSSSSSPSSCSGPNKLPQAGRQLGKALSEVRRWTSGMKSEIKTVVDFEDRPRYDSPEYPSSPTPSTTVTGPSPHTGPAPWRRPPADRDPAAPATARRQAGSDGRAGLRGGCRPAVRGGGRARLRGRRRASCRRGVGAAIESRGPAGGSGAGLGVSHRHPRRGSAGRRPGRAHAAGRAPGRAAPPAHHLRHRPGGGGDRRLLPLQPDPRAPDPSLHRDHRQDRVRDPRSPRGLRRPAQGGGVVRGVPRLAGGAVAALAVHHPRAAQEREALRHPLHRLARCCCSLWARWWPC